MPALLLARPKPNSSRSFSYVVRGVALALGIGLLVPASADAASKRSKATKGDKWPEISTAERSLKKLDQDPEADAVVLSMERSGKIVRKADDWVNVLSYHRRFKILTEAGERFGEIGIPSGKYSRVSNIRARTVKADGTAIPVPSDQILKKAITETGGDERAEWVFDFPAVEPGAILEYSYDRHDNSLYYIHPWFFEGPAYTLRSRVTQAIPDTMGYSILCDLCPAEVKPVVSQWREGKAKGQVYSMELVNLPGYRRETLTPSAMDVSPRLEMVLQAWKGHRSNALGQQAGLFTDWESVARLTSYQPGSRSRTPQLEFQQRLSVLPRRRRAVAGWRWRRIAGAHALVLQSPRVDLLDHPRENEPGAGCIYARTPNARLVTPPALFHRG